MANPRVLYDPSGKVTFDASGRVLMGQQGTPCCCTGGPTCCDHSNRIRYCGGPAEFYCCACGESYRFRVTLNRTSYYTALQWRGSAPYPPGPLYENRTSYRLDFAVACVDGVRVAVPAGENYLRSKTTVYEFVGGVGRFRTVGTPIDLSDFAAIRAHPFFGSDATVGWCGVNFSRFQHPSDCLWFGNPDLPPHPVQYQPHTHCGHTVSGVLDYTRQWTSPCVVPYGEALVRAGYDIPPGQPFESAPTSGQYRYDGFAPLCGASGNFADDLSIRLGNELLHTSSATATWTLSDATPCNPNPCDLLPSQLGACCPMVQVPGFPPAQCRTLTQGQCEASGGVFRGIGTACATANCPDLGACCVNGQCTETTEARCRLVLRGDWRGGRCTGTVCDPVGACCIGGVCNQTTRNQCGAAGGLYLGDGVRCATDVCPPGPPRGSCCLPGGQCVDNQTEAECNGIGGVIWWNGTLCENTACASAGRPGGLILPKRELVVVTGLGGKGGGCAGCGGGGFAI